MFRRKTTVILLFLFVFSIACGGDDPTPITIDNQEEEVDAGDIDDSGDDDSGDDDSGDEDTNGEEPAEAVDVLTTEGPIVIDEGDERWLDAWVVDDNGDTIADAEPAWEIVAGSDSAGFTISADGHLVAVGPAPAQGEIQATYEQLRSEPLAVDVVDPTACPEECTGGQVCDGDLNECVCPPATHLCDGLCVNSNSVDTCGDQCSPCQADNGFTPVCDNQQCDAICEAPKQVCGNACVSCPDDANALKVGCESNQCVITECAEGYEICDQGCCEASTPELVEGGSANIRGRLATAMDSAGNPHILFYDAVDEMLKYTFLDGAEWVVESVDILADNYVLNYQEGDWTVETASIHIDLAIDADDTLHIAYRNYEEGLKYGRRDGSGWDLTLLDDATQGFADTPIGYNSSLALDDDGHPHIAYLSDEGPLSLASFDGTQWNIEEIGGANRRSTALAIDDQQVMHLLYFRQFSFSERELVYAWREVDGGSSWTETTYDNEDTIDFYDLAVSADGSVAIAIIRSDSPDDYLELVDNRDGSWQTQIVNDDLEGSFHDTRVVMDSLENVYLTYRSEEPNSGLSGIVLASEGASEWETELIDEMPDAMPYLDLFIDGDDQLFAAYRDPVFDSVVWSERNGDQWNRQVATSGAPLVGDDGSLVAASDGTVHAIYRDDSNGRLRHARRQQEDDWLIDTIPVSASEIRDLTALQIASDDSLHFVYAINDHSEGLRYMTYDGSGWEEEVFEFPTNTFIRTGFNSFALADDDSPHILFHQRPFSGTDEYILASRSGAEWDFETIGELAITVASSALAIDSTGQAHIAGRNSAGIHYTSYDGQQWQEMLVDDAQTFEQFIDLALYDDAPYIVYSYATSSFGNLTGELYLAAHDGTQWSTDTIADEVHILGRKDLWIDGDGTLTITYYDEVVDQLAMSQGQGSQWQQEELMTRAMPGGLFIADDGEVSIGAATQLSRAFFYIAK